VQKEEAVHQFESPSAHHRGCPKSVTDGKTPSDATSRRPPECGGGNEIHRVGDRYDRSGVENDFFGIPAAIAQNRKHPLTNPQFSDGVVRLDDDASGLETRDKRKRRFNLVGAGDHQAIGKVDASRVYPNAHLVRLQFAPFHILKPEHIRGCPILGTGPPSSVSSFARGLVYGKGTTAGDPRC
jgi:hypothetical protein